MFFRFELSIVSPEFDNLQTRSFAAPRFAPTTVSKILGSWDFYFSAYLGLLPRRAGDMLAARFGQLTAEGLSPS